MNIHPTAIVHPKAQLASDVTVGAYCVIGEHVTIGKGTRLLSHVVVDGWTEIGERNELHPFASIGGAPQHLGYKGEPTKVVIGDDNILREYVTVNRATVSGGGVTSLGNHNFLMSYVHLAHDCRLGNHLIVANSANFAGHITVGDHAIIGGLTGVHQFVRIGGYSMVGGCCALSQDVPPFTRAAGGYRARLYGLNSVGLKRHQFSVERIAALRKAFDLIFREGHRIAEAAKLARERFVGNADVQTMVDFLSGTKRGISRAASAEDEADE
ncbi:MAG: acyl-ACP--UDP-N-acetylglucosamine O-acyltransferase [Nitrospiraceae bacterium]